MLGFAQERNTSFVSCCSELFAQHVHVSSEYETNALPEINFNTFSLSEIIIIIVLFRTSDFICPGFKPRMDRRLHKIDS